MRVKNIHLVNFRNYQELHFTPKPGITVFYGANGSGKTNLLEAVHLCCLGRSHRTPQDKELIRQGESMALCRMEVERLDGRHQVEVRLSSIKNKVKSVVINQKPAARIGELMGHVTCVIFSPEDLELIKDGPALRRRFMDMQLSQLRPSYFYQLQKYTQVLTQRNALLKQAGVEAGEESLRLLDAWDEQLADSGASLIRQRQWFVSELAPKGMENYQCISGQEKEKFEIAYVGSLAQSEIPYQKMLEGLKKTRRDDLYRGSTSFGPHRDDLKMTLMGKDMKLFASQGQIRTAALSMKLAELDMMKTEHGESPILLLDDVMSELDPRRRALLLGRIGDIQTFITCTDQSDLAGAQADEIIHVLGGSAARFDEEDKKG